MALLLPTALMLAGCGDGDGSDNTENGEKGSGAEEGDGTVAAPWDAYCVATFTADYEVMDVFDDTLFTASSGASYLVANLDNFGGEVELMYLTSKGPYGFEVPQSAPIETTCDASSFTNYVGVFMDMTIYADESLDTELCALTAGTVVEANGEMSGYSAVDLGFSGPSIYEVYLGGLSEQCEGAESGYVEVLETRVLGISTYLVPIQSFVGPAL